MLQPSGSISRGKWSELLLDRLRATFRKATVYALTFENMTREIALALHEGLSRRKATSASWR